MTTPFNKYQGKNNDFINTVNIIIDNRKGLFNPGYPLILKHLYNRTLGRGGEFESLSGSPCMTVSAIALALSGHFVSAPADLKTRIRGTE